MKKAGAIQSVKAFAKDGSRYTFTINSLNPNKAFAADYFRIRYQTLPRGKSGRFADVSKVANMKKEVNVFIAH